MRRVRLPRGRVEVRNTMDDGEMVARRRRIFGEFREPLVF